MMVNGKMICLMGVELFVIRMESDILVNGKTISCMAKEPFMDCMPTNFGVLTRMAKKMGMGHIKPTTGHIPAASRMAGNTV